MEHFIIIRFSTIFNNRPELKTTHIFDSDRLDFRFNLFSKYTLPSLVNQSLITFKIIIIYDKNLPTQYFDTLFHLTKDYDFIILHQWNINDNLVNNDWFLQYITNKNPDSYIITTRIDDDDMIHKNLNKKMISHIKKFYCKDSIITFSGAHFLKYINDNDMSIRKINYKSLSVFQTKIAKLSDINIYGHSHDNIKISHKIIKFNNAFVQFNHIYENDNRFQRFFNKTYTPISYTQLLSLLNL